MKTSDILSITDKYIEKYLKETDSKNETIYRIPSSDVAKLGPDFIRDDKSRVFFCFYKLTPDQYDNGGAQSFADAFFINGDTLRDGKIVLELNVNMPVRADGDKIYVDKNLMAELITHELTHAYRKSKELSAGHYKIDFSLLDFITRRKKKNRKYTTTQRMQAYSRTMPDVQSENDITGKMKWVGYTMVEDEMFANLAGIESFLASGGKINDSRGKQQVDIIKTYLDDIEKTATAEDWKKCMLDISYIPARKDESLDRFKRRWISYYRDRISKFYEKMEKLKERYSKRNSIKTFQKGKVELALKDTPKKMMKERD